MDVRGRKLAVNGVIADFGSETLRTASGHSVALRPQAFAVLRYLAEHAGQLVTKDELMHALWPGLARNRRQPRAVRPRNPPRVPG